MASTYLTCVKNSAAISSGGAVTIERYKGDNSSVWKKGQLVLLSSGVLVKASAGTATVDTDDIASGAKLFIALADLDVASSDYQEVQRVDSDTIFEGPLLSSDAGGTAPATAPSTIIGATYALYQDASGNWGPDKNVTAKALVEVTDVESEFSPFRDTTLFVDSNSERYNMVRFKFSSISNV